MRPLLVVLTLLVLLAGPALAQTPVPTVPASPSNLRAGLVTATSIEILWQDNAADEATVEVARGTVNPDGTLVGQGGASLPPDTVAWTDTGLAPDTLRYYNVRACNAAGCSRWAGEIRVRTLPEPTMTPTSTATPEPTETPTPEPTATMTATPAVANVCPGGEFVGRQVTDDVISILCVIARTPGTAWPEEVERWLEQP